VRQKVIEAARLAFEYGELEVICSLLCDKVSKLWESSQRRRTFVVITRRSTDFQRPGKASILLTNCPVNDDVCPRKVPFVVQRKLLIGNGTSNYRPLDLACVFVSPINLAESVITLDFDS
jgi:hypothetical protein